MRVDAIAVELRPRPMHEAGDLGARLVQANARSVWATCTPVFAAVFLLALSSVEIASWLPSVLIFWLKPWMDRSVLFVLSRAAFGQSTRFADLWRAQREVWWSQLFTSLTWRRLSPWRSYTQPIYQLEGQRGKARRQRRALMLRAQRGPVGAMHLVFAHAEAFLSLGLMAFIALLLPEGLRSDAWGWLTGGSVSASFATASVYALVVLVLEPFYVGAGFAMYLNRRVQLEAWDIEQEFRRAF
jgi:hypothetical protein